MLNKIPIIGTIIGLATMGNAQSSYSIVMCQDINFGGYCTTQYNQQYGVCYPVPDGYNDIISSIRVGDEGTNCYMYSDYYCQGDVEGPITWDWTYSDLLDYHGADGFYWNDVVSSYQCARA